MPACGVGMSDQPESRKILVDEAELLRLHEMRGSLEALKSFGKAAAIGTAIGTLIAMVFKFMSL
jgi:hypothetical protein